MFVTKYDIYSEYHPAEGGIYLTGRSVMDSEEVGTEANALNFLRGMFHKEMQEWGIPASAVNKDKHDWGTVFTASNEDVIISFFCSHEPMLGERSTDEYGFGHEDYESYVSVVEKSRYVDRFRYEYVPESEKGLHEHPAFYC